MSLAVYVCPVCERQIEWQGRDFGYLCQGPADDRHPAAYAVAEQVFRLEDVKALWEEACGLAGNVDQEFRVSSDTGPSDLERMQSLSWIPEDWKA